MTSETVVMNDAFSFILAYYTVIKWKAKLSYLIKHHVMKKYEGSNV
jgi:hypothetical protein